MVLWLIAIKLPPGGAQGPDAQEMPLLRALNQDRFSNSRFQELFENTWVELMGGSTPAPPVSRVRVYIEVYSGAQRDRAAVQLTDRVQIVEVIGFLLGQRIDFGTVVFEVLPAKEESQAACNDVKAENSDTVERLRKAGRSGLTWGTLAAVGVGLGTLVAAPVVLTAVGFTAAGIAAGSLASSMMSAAAIANGGTVAAGSMVAVLQSLGTGVGLGAVAAVSGAAAGTTAAVAGAAVGYNQPGQDTTNKDKKSCTDDRTTNNEENKPGADNSKDSSKDEEKQGDDEPREGNIIMFESLEELVRHIIEHIESNNK